MKSKNTNSMSRVNIFLVLLSAATFIAIAPNWANAKSLYIIADIKGSSTDATLPVQAYNIGVDGTLTFQAQHDIPHTMLGAVGMAIDDENGYLFITYEASGDIQLIEATTMTDAGRVRAPDASDLAGIVYDNKKGLLYTIDRGNNSLYVYDWWPDTATLTHVPGSPFTLENAHAYGITLDEIDNLLYVGNANNTVTVYSTSDWQLVDTITLSRIAISIAVDVNNGYIYTGGGFAGNMFLTQYHLATGTEAEVQVEPDAGVMGLGVDHDTGLVYITTGSNDAPGGDNLQVYDSTLDLIDIVTAIGNPTGLAVPGKEIGYNPLNLSKQVLRGANTSADFDDMKTVEPGTIYTYGISFENHNDFIVTDVTITDILPEEAAFVTATDDGVNGHYNFDEQTGQQTFTWTYEGIPPQTSTLLEITVQVNPNIVAGTIISNSVTINSNQTPPTTTGVDVTVTSNDLNLRKVILGVPEGQIAQVDTNDTITYIIEFDNKDNDFPVTNVTVIDQLQKDVTFISANDGNATGKYDEKSHIYTWTFDSLEPGATAHLELVVSVNPGLALGTVITNIVTIDSNETADDSASVDAMTYYKPLNITKKAVDNEGNELGWVDPGDRLTYQICFDNNDNESEVTEVTVVDQLPDELIFVMADDGKATGKYDAKTHTYTWTYGPLNSGMADCVELVVDVNENTPLDTMIANTVTIDSNETLPATASAYLSVGEPLLEVDNLEVSTSTISYDDPEWNITFILELPESIGIDDVIDEPLILYPAYIESYDQQITETDGKVTITAVFDKYELLDAMYDYDGPLDLIIEGILASGQIFFGETTINIIQTEDIFDDIYIDIYMEHIWVYNDPADDSDLTFEFRLIIDVIDINPTDEENVHAIEFTTPAGKTFLIPKQPGQWSGGIWTSYEYDADWDWATWQYRAKLPKLADLQQYGDGEYTITTIYKDGSKEPATVWFGIPGTNDPIPQPTQKPVLTSPSHTQEVESPVTFNWEPCTDPNASEVGIEMQELRHGDFKEEYFDISDTNWGPVILTDGTWETDLIFGQWATQMSDFDSNVFFSFSKSSRSRYNFTVVGYPRNTYEVWGGNTWIYWEDGSYRRIADLEGNGYKKLGESDGRTASFSGEYSYYLIATRGQFLLDSIQGSDGSYYSSFEANCSSGNMSNEDYLLGPTDGQHAIVGSGSIWYQDDFSGYIAFTNPGNWTGLTVIVGEILQPALSIIPEVLRRNGTSQYITAVVQFPGGIQQSEIDPDDRPALYYQNRDTGAFIFIGNGSPPNLSGNEISISFSRAELMGAIYGYGEFTLRVEGKLKTGQSYSGEDIIYITKFAGD